MIILFEVYLTHGGNPDALLSADVLAETHAQVMTPEQAKAVGFDGLKLQEGVCRLVAVSARDAQFVQRRLEGNPNVDRFRLHEVDA